MVWDGILSSARQSGMGRGGGRGRSGDRDIGTSGHRVKPTTEGQIHKDKYMETMSEDRKSKKRVPRL